MNLGRISSAAGGALRLLLHYMTCSSLRPDAGDDIGGDQFVLIGARLWRALLHTLPQVAIELMAAFLLAYSTMARSHDTVLPDLRWILGAGWLRLCTTDRMV